MLFSGDKIKIFLDSYGKSKSKNLPIHLNKKKSQERKSFVFIIDFNIFKLFNRDYL